MNIENLMEVFSISSVPLLIGLLIKFYSYVQKQTVKEETIKNKLETLTERIKYNDNKTQELNHKLELGLSDLQSKTEVEFRLILDKLEKNSQIHSQKVEEVKNLIIDLFRSKDN